MRHYQHLIHRNCINGIHQSKSRSIRPQWRKVKGKNKIIKVQKDSELAGALLDGIEAYTIEGQNARDAAKNKGEQYQGHPQGKRPDASL